MQEISNYNYLLLEYAFALNRIINKGLLVRSKLCNCYGKPLQIRLLKLRLGVARPRKEIEYLRLHQVNIRLTESEFELAKDRASVCGLSVANWIRATAFNFRAPIAKKHLFHKEVYTSLSRIGANLNQLTKMGHTWNVDYEELAKQLGATYELLKSIQQQILDQ